MKPNSKGNGYLIGPIWCLVIEVRPVKHLQNYNVREIILRPKGASDEGYGDLVVSQIWGIHGPGPQAPEVYTWQATTFKMKPTAKQITTRSGENMVINGVSLTIGEMTPQAAQVQAPKTPGDYGRTVYEPDKNQLPPPPAD